MGRFATGVTVVTTAQRDHVHGMTANGVMSVSLDPPLVVVSLGRLQDGRAAAAHAPLRDQRAGRRPGGARERTSPAARSRRSRRAFTWWKELPFVEGALAHVGCRVEAIHEAGDHRLWVGRVEYMEYRDGDPLVFFAGRFDRLSR